MAGAIRAAGWFTALGAPAEDGWLLAGGRHGLVPRREPVHGREAQLSPIAVDDIAARTDRYAAEGTRVCWVSPDVRPPQWSSAVPAVRVRAPQEREQQWVVDDGLAGFAYRSGRWECRDEPLERFVRWALEEQVMPAEVLSRYGSVNRTVEQGREHARTRPAPSRWPTYWFGCWRRKCGGGVRHWPTCR